MLIRFKSVFPLKGRLIADIYINVRVQMCIIIPSIKKDRTLIKYLSFN